MSSDKRGREAHQHGTAHNVNTVGSKTPTNGSRATSASTPTNSSSTPTPKPTTPKPTPPTVKLSLFDLDIPTAEPPSPSTPTVSAPSSTTKGSPVPMVTFSLTEFTEQVDIGNTSESVPGLTEELHALLLDEPAGTTTNEPSNNEESEEWEKWEDEPIALPIIVPSPPTNTKPRVRGRGGSRFNGEEASELGTVDGVTEDDSSDSSATQQGTNSRSNKDHILEIYNIPVNFKTTDLENIFDKYRNLVRFKWVNDTSALAIFRTALFACDVLESITHPTVKLRPLSEAPEEARTKALATPTLPTTTVARPYKTTTTVARRLIANALQMPALTAGRTSEDDVRDAKRRVWDE